MDDPQNYSSNLPAVNGAIQSIDMFGSNYYFLLAKGPLATDSSLAYHTIKLSGGTSVNLTQAGVNFINVFTYSFYACRSQKRKMILTTWLSSYAFGIYERKSCT